MKLDTIEETIEQMLQSESAGQAVEWITISNVTIGVFPVLELLAPELEVRVTSRLAGVSPEPFDSLNLGDGLGDSRRNVLENKRILTEALGIIPGNIASAGQVHGSEVAIVRSGGTYEGVDGLITSTRGLTLVVRTADCLPVIIYSPTEKVLAAIHVGRTGALRGIIPRTVETLSKGFGIDVENTIALIGPGICRTCYVVWKRTALRFPETCRSFRGGAWRLDLLGYSRRELRRCGIRAKHIVSSKLCTSCDPVRFFSHKRDGPRTGRHWTLATIRRQEGETMTRPGASSVR